MAHTPIRKKDDEPLPLSTRFEISTAINLEVTRSSSSSKDEFASATDEEKK